MSKTKLKVESNSRENNEVDVEKSNDESTLKNEVKPAKKRSGGWYHKGKMFYKWPGLLHTYVKANKIMKKNAKSSGTYSEEYRYEWTKKRVLKILPVLNLEIQVGGIENWLDRGVVLMPNHQSNFDVLALIAINDFQKQQPLAFIGKKELWESKKTLRFVNLIDAIPLDRKSPRSALKAFKQGKELIVDYKRSLVIFPEGTRGDSNVVQTFLPASMKIAQMSNAPIIPVSFINTYKVLDKKSRKLEPKLVVKVVFNKPIMPQKHLQLSTDLLANLVQKEVQKGIDENINKELTPLKTILNPEKAAKKAEKAKNRKRNKKRGSPFKIV